MFKRLNEGFDKKYFIEADTSNNVTNDKPEYIQNMEKQLHELAIAKLSQGISNIKDFEYGFQSVIEAFFPDNSWWDVTDCNIFWTLFETKDVDETIDRIIEGIKPEFLTDDVISKAESKKTDLEAEADINAHEAEFGADGTRVFRDVPKNESLKESSNAEIKNIDDVLKFVKLGKNVYHFDDTYDTYFLRDGTVIDIDKPEDSVAELSIDEIVSNGGFDFNGQTKILTDEEILRKFKNDGLITDVLLKSFYKNESFKESADVTDQVVIDIDQPGFITKKHELQDKGYKVIWVGNRKICLAKPKQIGESKLNEMNDSELNQARVDLYDRIRKRVGDRDMAKARWTKSENHRYDELSCIGMINSILAYKWHPGSKTAEEVLESEENSYRNSLGEYINDLGRDRVLELIQQQMDDIESISHCVSTDSEGNWYNSINWKSRKNESLKESFKEKFIERNLTRAEKINRDFDKIWSNKKSFDKKYADFLKKNGYTDEQIDELSDKDDLSGEIARKFTPDGKQPSYILGKILDNKNESLKESTSEDGDKPYTYKQMYDELKSEGVLDKDKGAFSVGFKEEKEHCKKILDRKGFEYEVSLDDRTNPPYYHFEYWKKSLKTESKKPVEKPQHITNESFGDDIRIYMNTWSNYNENGADLSRYGINSIKDGWLTVDEAIEFCEEHSDDEPFINDTDNVPFAISEYDNAYEVLQELQELQSSDADEDIVAAVIEATGCDIGEAISIVEDGDYCWYPNVYTESDLAYAVIDEIGGLKEAVGDKINDYIDEDMMRRDYEYDVRDMLYEEAEDEVEKEHRFDDEDEYDKDQEIEDYIDEHLDSYLDSIIEEDIALAEMGEVDLSNYFDYEAYGRDLTFDDYTFVDGGCICVLR